MTVDVDGEYAWESILRSSIFIEAQKLRLKVEGRSSASRPWLCIRSQEGRTEASKTTEDKRLRGDVTIRRIR